MTSTTMVANHTADIVVGVDGTDESFAALSWGMREAAASGQYINAVFSWTSSWDMGSQPDNEEAWTAMRHRIAGTLRDWVSDNCQQVEFDPHRLKLTSVRASGATALLSIGRHAQQIVVGRRSMSRVMRWFLGSLPESVAQEACVPVTVVPCPDHDLAVRDAIADALSERTPATELGAPGDKLESAGIVVGIDGTETSIPTLRFAAREALLHHYSVHVMFCWQHRDIDTLPGMSPDMPDESIQRQAEHLVRRCIQDAQLPDEVSPIPHAFPIAPAKGLLNASRYARHMVVSAATRHGIDPHELGSVAKTVAQLCECPVSIVH